MRLKILASGQKATQNASMCFCFSKLPGSSKHGSSILQRSLPVQCPTFWGPGPERYPVLHHKCVAQRWPALLSHGCAISMRARAQLMFSGVSCSAVVTAKRPAQHVLGAHPRSARSCPNLHLQSPQMLCYSTVWHSALSSVNSHTEPWAWRVRG